MKKSKIIIPAAAILALSVGASVTGTVAWFTASRTASFGVNNMAVINTAGDLKVSLTEGIGTEITGTTPAVKLSYLRDASYDAINNQAYVATLNNDGTYITGTRNVERTLTESVSITEGSSSSYNKVYVINEWTATFETSSVAVNYLYFNPTATVSKINGTALDNKSVYKAVRVAMRNTAGDDKHTVIWAPYTTDGDVYYVNKAGTLKTSQPSNVAPTPANYLNNEDPQSSLVGKYYSSVESENLVAKDGDALVSEGISNGAAKSNTALLSTKLQGKHDDGHGQDVEASKPSITFTLWFEGLDPNCISAADIKDVSTTTMKAVKDMTLGFYAVDSSTFTA